jgi:hypothetical protein
MNNKLLIGVLIVIVAGLAYFSMTLSSSGTSGGQSDRISLSTDPDPLRPGKATFIISVKDAAGKPVDNAKVFFDLNMTAMNMGTQRGDAISQGNGAYAASGNMSMRGPWRVSTKVTMPEGSVISRDFTVNVP